MKEVIKNLLGLNPQDEEYEIILEDTLPQGIDLDALKGEIKACSFIGADAIEIKDIVKSIIEELSQLKEAGQLLSKELLALPSAAQEQKLQELDIKHLRALNAALLCLSTSDYAKTLKGIEEEDLRSLSKSLLGAMFELKQGSKALVESILKLSYDEQEELLKNLKISIGLEFKPHTIEDRIKNGLKIHSLKSLAEALIANTTVADLQKRVFGIRINSTYLELALIPQIQSFLKLIPQVETAELAIDRKFATQERRLNAIIADINNNKLPPNRYWELLHENLYSKSDEGLKHSRTFLAYAIPKLTDLDGFLKTLKDELGPNGFDIYINTPLILAGKEEVITINDLYLKKQTNLNSAELLLAQTQKDILKKYLLKEAGKKEEKVIVVNVAQTNTHNTSSHRSADESHVGAFRMMVDANPQLGVKAVYSNPNSNGKKPREVDLLGPLEDRINRCIQSFGIIAAQPRYTLALHNALKKSSINVGLYMEDPVQEFTRVLNSKYSGDKYGDIVKSFLKDITQALVRELHQGNPPQELQDEFNPLELYKTPLDHFVQAQLKDLQSEIDGFINTDYAELYEAHIRLSSNGANYQSALKTNEAAVRTKLDALKDLDIKAFIDTDRANFYEKYIRPDQRKPTYTDLTGGQKAEIDAQMDSLVALNVAEAIEANPEEFYDSYLRFHLKDPVYKELNPAQKEAVDKNIEGILFQANAAKRFMDSMIGSHRCDGNDAFKYSTDDRATCGLTMEEMVATCYWASKDRDNFKKSAKHIYTAQAILFNIIKQLYDMRRGYNIDYGTDKPDEGIFPTKAKAGKDKNRCHGGCVNSLASALNGIYKAYKIKNVKLENIQKYVRDAYKEIVEKNLEYIKKNADEAMLWTWSSSGEVTGKIRQTLQDNFDEEYRQKFIKFRGYMSDTDLESIINNGLENLPIPENLKQKYSIDGMNHKEINQGVANSRLPIIHLDPEKGYESTLSYLSRSNTSLVQYIMDQALVDIQSKSLSPYILNHRYAIKLRYLIYSKLENQYGDIVVFTIEDRPILLREIVSLNRPETLERLLDCERLEDILELSIETEDIDLFVFYALKINAWIKGSFEQRINAFVERLCWIDSALEGVKKVIGIDLNSANAKAELGKAIGLKYPAGPGVDQVALFLTDIVACMTVQGEIPPLLATLLRGYKMTFDTRYSRYGHNLLTPLHFAINKGLTEAVKSIFTAPDARDALSIESSIGTPMFTIVIRDNAALLKTFLETDEGKVALSTERMDPGPGPQDEGSTLLHDAIRYGCADSVNIILGVREGRELLNILDGYGNTPLDVAINVGNIEAIRAILATDEGVATITSLILDCKLTDDMGVLEQAAAGFHWAQIVVELLKANKTIPLLSVSHGSLSNEEVRIIAAELKDNKVITSFKLSCGLIDLEGIKAIAELLRDNNTLVSIDLTYSGICVEGLTVLAHALKNNKTLTSLALPKDLQEVDIIIEMLKSNKTIVNLSLVGLSNEGMKAIVGFLKENDTFTSLDFSHSQFGKNVGHELAVMLAVSKTLISINLAYIKATAWSINEISNAIMAEGSNIVFDPGIKNVGLSITLEKRRKLVAELAKSWSDYYYCKTQISTDTLQGCNKYRSAIKLYLTGELKASFDEKIKEATQEPVPPTTEKPYDIGNAEAAERNHASGSSTSEELDVKPMITHVGTPVQNFNDASVTKCNLGENLTEKQGDEQNKEKGEPEASFDKKIKEATQEPVPPTTEKPHDIGNAEVAERNHASGISRASEELDVGNSGINRTRLLAAVGGGMVSLAVGVMVLCALRATTAYPQGIIYSTAVLAPATLVGIVIGYGADLDKGIKVTRIIYKEL